ncbi:MAG: hypothetical protein HON98_02315 [Chloroflexi bacterium]|jgi:hypothetical protein|nr:hypothetical protein [Chloroflexota bacterium]MBT3668678.1 hypothetical protein [Chloroflexota bacterium]MBT4001919.1 hypothetical protein [Chloroflexota bacterium]MBT4305379.1 hypothetical protein [Chloroflexota bacterium]MBT4532525.1 hypothetical protein [Chloroflexota bacterium]
MIQSAYITALQDTHQFQGKTNDCAAISVAMACNVFNQTSVDGYELGQELNGFTWRGAFPLFRRIPDNAVMPWGMTDAAKQFGLRASWRMFKKEEQLKEKINQDIILLPIIGRWKPLYAHVMPLVAFDETKGWGFVNPAKKKNTIYFISEEKFRIQWKWSLNMLVEIKRK